MKKIILISLLVATSMQAVTGLELLAGVSVAGWFLKNKHRRRVLICSLCFFGRSKGDCTDNYCKVSDVPSEGSVVSVCDQNFFDRAGDVYGIDACKGILDVHGHTQKCQGHGELGRWACDGTLTTYGDNTMKCEGSLKKRTAKSSCECDLSN